MKFVIWSYEHRAWWRPKWSGYTTNFGVAGHYTAEEAGRAVTGSALIGEIAIREDIGQTRGPPPYHPYDGKEWGSYR